jgi:2-polyprenyl-3-methyl-5-hydroxy-6-metoxy-1,4-benzoquinol methylase
VATDAAGFVSGVPERYVPDLMRGELVEAEHLSRYRWAAQLVPGRRVLDAACGVGYGSVILAEAGAQEVVGVDISEPALELARENGRDGVRFVAGDLHALDLPDGAFDVVVCFEAIEHVDDPGAVLDELARVLAPGGVLAVSSPNPRVYPEGNPHHHRELTPEELEQELTRRFGQVRLYRQDTWVLSSILDGDAVLAGHDEPLEELTLRKALPPPPGGELYAVALAGDGPLPDPRPLGTLTHPVEPRRWLEEVRRLRAVVADQTIALRELETLKRERAQLAGELEESERRLARIPFLEQEFEKLAQSFSWRVTRPLRAVKARVGRPPER